MINDIDELPLKLFMLCLFEHKYEVLGEADEGTLRAAWQELYTQFIDLNGSDTSEYVLSLRRDIEALTYKITTTEGALQLLKKIHDERIVEVLKSLRYNTDKLIPGLPDYERQIKVIEGHLPPLKNRLLMKQEELREFEQEQNEGKSEAMTRESMKGWMVRLSRFMHFPVREDTMTGEYVRMTRDYINYYSKSQPKTEEDGV